MIELAHDWENVCDLLGDEFVELSSIRDDSIEVGQIPILDFSDDDEAVVKKNLENICWDLKKSLDKRMKQLAMHLQIIHLGIILLCLMMSHNSKHLKNLL